MGKPKAKKPNNLLKEAQLEERQQEHSKHGGLLPESVLFTATLCCSSKDFLTLSYATTDLVMSMVPEFDLLVFCFGFLHLCLYMNIYTCINIMYMHAHTYA